jgi:hypothetical protein
MDVAHNITAQGWIRRLHQLGYEVGRMVAGHTTILLSTSMSMTARSGLPTSSTTRRTWKMSPISN